MIQTHRKNGLAYDIEVNLHHLTTDVKAAIGGNDAGPDPHEILEASLGACTSITVQMYANHKGWDLRSCNANVKFVREDAEAIVIERKISFEGNLDDEQKKRLMEIAEKCPIHKVITRGATINTSEA